MSTFTTVLHLVGAGATAVAFPVLFARRHPNKGGWLLLGILIGLAAMFIWPLTLWIAAAMWLIGFTRPPVPAGRRKRLVLPLCSVGAIVTLVVIGSTAGPPPARTPRVEPVAAPLSSAAPPPTTSGLPPATTVVDVVDGDTVTLDNGSVVRIIGIDAPESVAPGRPVACWGVEAASFAHQTLLDMPVTVVPDPTQDAVDAFGRVLAYLVLSDGRDFSVLAAEGGHARAYTYGRAPQHLGAITAAESRARDAAVGLWGPACGPPAPSPAEIEAAELDRQTTARAAEARRAVAVPAPAAAPPRRAPAPAAPRAAAPAPASGGGCAPGYSPCVPSYPPDLDCRDLDGPYRVTGSDPHNLDGNNDGRGCE